LIITTSEDGEEGVEQRKSIFLGRSQRADELLKFSPINPERIWEGFIFRWKFP
jgi:hypothetical protein